MLPVCIRSTLLLALAMSAAQDPGPAHAQPRRTPLCEERPECVSLYDQAKEQSARGNLVGALRFYELAYRVNSDPRLLFSIARVHHKLGRSEEAAAGYQRFIESPIDDPDQKDVAREYLEQLRPAAAGSPRRQRTPSQSSAGNQARAGGPTEALPAKKPLYGQWWFWTGIGVLTVGTGLAIGLGVYARPPSYAGAAALRPFP